MAKKENLTFSRPAAPPSPLFFGEKERNFVKQINDEITERILPQAIVYYPISIEHSHFHDLYGEAIEKTFLPPVRVAARVEIGDGRITTTEKYNLDQESRIIVRFQKRRITEDLDLFVRQGDIIFYGNQFYEIHKVGEPDELFSQSEHRFEITAECLRVRGGQFDEPIEVSKVRELFRIEPITAPQEVANKVSFGCGGKIQVLSASDTSGDFSTILNMINNPGNFKSCVVYIHQVGNTLYPPFNEVDKFYFNEGGVWIVSPFELGV